mmetsp:Transcript_30440/g.63562  ORF Transcript_30440/g.63562 Transcript_30440/m.63562 type:complete len:242 (+) Transcript_30440:3-728(+)
MQIGRDTCHSWHSKIKLGHHVASLAHKGQNESTRASINMEQNTCFEGNLCQWFDRINQPVWICRRRTYHHNGGGGHGRSHGTDIGAKIISQGCVHHLDPKIMPRLFNCRMNRQGNHNFGRPTFGIRVGEVRPSPFSRGVHGHDNAFGTTGRHVAHHILISPQQAGTHIDHFTLKLFQAGECSWVQGIFGHEHGVGFLDHLTGFFPTIIHQAEYLSIAPTNIASAGLLHGGQNLIFGLTFFG